MAKAKRTRARIDTAYPTLEEMRVELALSRKRLQELKRMSDINKPTGLGFQGSPYRKCENCGHSEQLHFERVCGFGRSRGLCTCRSFCARKLSEAEKRIIAEQEQTERELEYVGEALYRELKRADPSRAQDEQRS